MDKGRMKELAKKFRFIIIFAAALLMVAHIDCNADEIADSDFIKADGKVLRVESGTGAKIVLRGVNAGGWLVQEPWMCPTTAWGDVQDQMTIESTLVSRFGQEQADELLDVYLDNYWTEEDFDNCQEMGMNVIRLPFWYRNIIDENGNVKDDAFERIDWFVEQAGSRGIYVILDMHGAPGSQNGEVHSGDINSGLGLWSGVDEVYNQNLFVKVWTLVAKHYEGNPAVAGYDLLNEPYNEDGEYTNSQVWDLYDKAYDAIREVDADHLIIMEATWEPYNLPNPTTYGWNNVMYEYHSYNYDEETDSDAQLQSINRKISLINAMGYDVPSYIGETSFFSNMESWEKCLGALNDTNISWTVWTYKVTGDGTNSWGLYNMNIDSANLFWDSYDTIQEKWAASATDEQYINSELVQIVSKYISYSFTLTDVGDATVTGVANQVYTGKAIKPSVTVKYKNTVLKENTDYRLTYSNNIKCGTATITITGIGDYTGTKTVTFKIVPGKVKKLKATKKNKKSIILKWKKVKGADGYTIYRSKKKKKGYKKVKNISSGKKKKCTLKVKKKRTYYFKVRAYVKNNGKKIYGKYSKIKKVKIR